MSRFFVESVRYSLGEGGMACGPVSGEFMVSIKFKKDDEPSKWLTVIEITDFIIYFLENEDRFERHINLDADNSDEIEELNKYEITEFEGIDLGESYDDIFDQILQDEKDNPAAPLLRYVITLLDAHIEECDSLVELATGKYIDEVDIPASGAELGYYEDLNG